MSSLERVSLAIDGGLLEEFDALVERGGHENRSEAVRDLIRARLAEERWAGADRVVGTLTLIFDHTQRRLADRLLDVGHAHHAEITSTLHVHLDRDNCLEVLVLMGKAKELRRLAAELVGMKGVKHGKLVMSDAVQPASR